MAGQSGKSSPGERLAAALEAGDLGVFADLYVEDAVMYHPLMPGGIRGHDAIRASEQELLDAFSEISVEIRSVAAGERSSVAEIVLRATHTGPLDVGAGAPLPATHNRIELAAVWWFDLDPDGRILEERDYFDPATLMEQLGIAS